MYARLALSLAWESVWSNCSRSLDERMARSLNTVEAPTALVDRVAEVATRMRGAREENGRYEHEVELRAEIKRLKDLLQSEKETILVVIEKTILHKFDPSDSREGLVVQQYVPIIRGE